MQLTDTKKCLMGNTIIFTNFFCNYYKFILYEFDEQILFTNTLRVLTIFLTFSYDTTCTIY